MLLAASAVPYLRREPEVMAAIVFLVGTMLGILGTVVVQALRGRAALDVERLKLRHEIARRWLEDFDAHVADVRVALDAVTMGHVLSTSEDVLRTSALLDRFSHATAGLGDRALTVSLGFRSDERDSPAGLILDAARLVLRSGDSMSREWNEWLSKHPRDKLERERAPVLFMLGDLHARTFGVRLASLRSAIYWASEQRIARPHVRANAAEITRFLRGAEGMIEATRAADEARSPEGATE